MFATIRAYLYAAVLFACLMAFPAVSKANTRAYNVVVYPAITPTYALLCTLPALEQLACNLNLSNALDLDCDCDTSTHSVDCNDYDDTIRPGITEVPGNNVDNNCNGSEVCYTDADNDTYRPNSTSTVSSADVDCSDNNEAVSADLTTDCDDGSATTYPGATETIGNGVDEDCSGDEICYLDSDDDNYRPNTTATTTSADVDCTDTHEAVSGDSVGDCNDGVSGIHPGATENCDNVDEDCDSVIDDGYEFEFQDWYYDGDQDGHGDSNEFMYTGCLQPYDGTSNQHDCDDADPLTYPGSTEVCDDKDNDCDGFVDQTDSDHDNYPEIEFRILWYRDADLDGYGTPHPSDEDPPIYDCEQPDEGHSQYPFDCDDGDPEHWIQDPLNQEECETD